MRMTDPSMTRTRMNRMRMNRPSSARQRPIPPAGGLASRTFSPTTVVPRLALGFAGGLAAALLVSLGWATASADPAPNGDRIRDRILSRIERGRLMRAPEIGGGRTVAGGGAGYESVVVGGKVRLFLRYTPNRVLVSGKPAPMLFVLHSDRTRADQVSAVLAMNRLADADGFIAVYPQAAGERWNDLDGEAEDVEFVNRLADGLVAQNIADPRRIYLVGLGGGAGPALRAACTEGSRFAAYAVLGTVVGAGRLETCLASPPHISVISGTSIDPPATATTGKATTSPAKLSDPAAEIAEKLDCQEAAPSTTSGRLQRARWTRCREGGEVEGVRWLERVPADRAGPEIISYFRRFGL